MKLKQYIILFLSLAAFATSAHADADKAKLLSSEDDNSPEAQKYAKLVDIYTEALEKDDVPLHVKCLNDIIKYCHESNQPKREADAISTRVVYFYNRSLDDSLAKYAPQDLKVLEQYKNWKRYYELWTYLANSYLYSGKPNLALREAQAMFEDAKNRDNQLGMGLSYYTMGSIYTTLNVLDESINNYQKGLDILSTIRPYPSNLAELYSYYCDVLNMKQDYHTLEKVTRQWNDFLQKYLTEGRFDQETVNTFYCNYFIACAQASMGLGKLEQADEQMKKAKDNLNADTDFTHLSWLLNMAKLRYQQGRYMEALEFNNRRYSLSSQMDDAPSLVDVVKQRAEIFQRLGRYKESTQFFQRLYQLTDSINVQDTKSQLNEMNTLFKVDELKMAQERELYELNMKREREQFRLTMIIVGVIVLALVVFTVFRIISARRLKRAHEELQQTHDKLLTAYDQLEETTTAKERIESDLRIARDIQQSMIPQKFPPFPERTDIDLFASMTPAKAVGGDLYDFILLGEKLYFCLGDVSGKGVPASLFMAVARNLFRVVSQQGLPPADIADKMNNALSEDNDSGMFVTMFIGIIDLTTGRLDFCNAGHNPPVIKMADGSARFIEMEANAPLGLWAGLPYEGEFIEDISGCPFFVYSDGLNEAMDDKNEQYGDDLLIEMIEKHPFISSQETVEMMKADVVRHANGAEQSDDLTMLCVKVKGNIPN